MNYLAYIRFLYGNGNVKQDHLSCVISSVISAQVFSDVSGGGLRELFEKCIRHLLWIVRKGDEEV
jgi:hypothetical protein